MPTSTSRGTPDREAVRIEIEYLDAHLAFVEPAVPTADRESFEGADVGLAFAMRLDRLLVGRLVACIRIHDGDEREPGAVVGEHRRARAAGQAREALRLAAGREIQQIELRRVVVVAQCAEHDAPAVGTPDDAAFRAPRRREPAARLARAGVDEPEVRKRGVVVRGLAHRHDDPLAIGAHLRSADALHQPDVLVRGYAPGSGVGYGDDGKRQTGDQQQGFHVTKFNAVRGTMAIHLPHRGADARLGRDMKVIICNPTP